MSSITKSTCDRLSKNCKVSSIKSDKVQRAPTPKRVISSKKVPARYAENKSYSAGVILTVKSVRSVSKPKKTTRSDQNINKITKNTTIDYCKNCGDVLKKSKPTLSREEDVKTMVEMINEKSVRNDNQIKSDKKQKTLHQYYKNENFRMSTESVHRLANTRKRYLDTIREAPEMYMDEAIFEIYSEDEDDDSQDLYYSENIQELKKFRENNYFECHSAKSKLNIKSNVTSLNEHKCVYRFYLNERLFPVPLNSDYNNRIRCVECNLPMDMKNKNVGTSINGTIQAKVKLGKGDIKDMILLLPVKDSVIINERRKVKNNDEEIIYFGVIKLDANGNSMFNRTQPTDSLALRYQKGFKEFEERNTYSYKDLDDNDVLFI